MSNYLIGIGGTGAKCLESLIHLSAAGFLNQEQCKVFFVDLDASNGSLGRAQTTLQKYRNCKDIEIGGADAFSADIASYEKRLWNPLPEAGKRSLSEFYGYEDPNERNQISTKLIDALFAPEHIHLKLDEGFRGVTSIGAAIMAGTVDLLSEEPWNQLFDDLQHDASNSGGASLTLVGSVFGGTGASGIPTIGRLIADHLRKVNIKNVRLSAILLLPYFSFGDVKEEAVHAQSKKFLPATQAALNYYNDRQYLTIFNAVYLIGEHNLGNVPVPSVGGSNQENDPHPVEIYAALAAIDFMTLGEEAHGCMVVARNRPEDLTWTDFPSPRHLDFRNTLGQFLRFSYAYVAACYPALSQFITSRAAYRTPWIGNFLKTPNTLNFQELSKNAEHMRAYCEAFLIWLGSMNIYSRQGQLSVSLAYADRFVQSVGDPPRVVLKPHLDPSFDNLLLPPRSKEGLSFTKFWERLADSKPTNAQANQGFAQLVTRIYELAAIS